MRMGKGGERGERWGGEKWGEEEGKIEDNRGGGREEETGEEEEEIGREENKKCPASALCMHLMVSDLNLRC